MVHGNPTWSFYWRNLVTAFGGEHRVVVPDHVGCGLSDKPANYNYTLTQHTQNLQNLVEQLDLQEVTLLCHDWGGAIGLGAAVAMPERFSRIVLMNTGAFPPPYFPRRIRVCRTPVLGRVAVQGYNLFALSALAMAVGDSHQLAPEVQAGLLAPYDSWANRRAVYEFVRDIPSGAHHPNWQVLERLEEKLRDWNDIPVSLIWGMQDWCFNEVCLNRFMEIFPQAGVTRIEHAGHYVVEDAPTEIIDTVRAFIAAEHDLAPTQRRGS